MTSLTLCETGSQFDLWFIMAKLSKMRAITLCNFFNEPTRRDKAILLSLSAEIFNDTYFSSKNLPFYDAEGFKIFDT